MKDRIITFLKEAKGYLSGEDISRRLKISRSAVWKNISELRKEGYEIEAVTHGGYKLIGIPDKLIQREIVSGLQTKWLAQQIHIYDQVESTMDIATQLAIAGCEHGTLVLCESQTKGRGRMGRSWQSKENQGLYMSYVLRPNIHPSRIATITFISAVALCEVLKESFQIDAQIKWPNDVLVNGEKISGILTEMNAQVDGVRFVVVGLGLNINAKTSDLPAGSTSIRHLTGKKHHRVELLQSLCLRLEHWYEELINFGDAPIIDRWKQLSSTLGHKVCLSDSGMDIKGQAIDLDEHGGIIIKTEDGRHVKKLTGHLTHL